MSLVRAACRPGSIRILTRPTVRGLALTARELGHLDRVYPASALAGEGGWLVAGRAGHQRMIVAGHRGSRPPGWLAWPTEGSAPLWREAGVTIQARPWDEGVMRVLQRHCPWLRPGPAGQRPSLGLGDRIGLATPGHLAAVAGTPLFPVVAQQSIREMTRTSRTPEEVMSDAVFGVLEAGWTRGFGADADHLKTVADVDRCAAAGFVLFTLDGTDVIGAREQRGATPARRWGRAVALFTRLARRVRRQASGPYEIEVSLDELPFPTSLADHRYVVEELRRRGVRIHQLAPRFPGAFEKGVDYRGDRRELAHAVAAHATLARRLGGHKLSIHSGSDKFAAYRTVARETCGAFHLKTAGTSYLEALRVAARRAPGLFRDIVAASRTAFARDRATYHVSARLARVPAAGGVPDRRLERTYLVPDDARQVLHVAFGSVLTARDPHGWVFRDGLHALLIREERLHRAVLARHLGRHARALAVS